MMVVIDYFFFIVKVLWLATSALVTRARFRCCFERGGNGTTGTFGTNCESGSSSLSDSSLSVSWPQRSVDPPSHGGNGTVSLVVVAVLLFMID